MRESEPVIPREGVESQTEIEVVVKIWEVIPREGVERNRGEVVYLTRHNRSDPERGS